MRFKKRSYSKKFIEENSVYIIELIAEIVKRPVSTIRYIIKNRALDNYTFFWKKEHNDWAQLILT